ncbi:MAG: hypothetical protein JO142_02265 [Burkholderiales bacterium]|nr:hypothetical protein [Burkholderiales bacterium]
MGSAPSVTVKIGSVTLQDTEVPESIKVRRTQKVVTHDHIGKGRTADMMGDHNEPFGWSGWLLGASAVDRMFALRQLLIDAAPVKLQFGRLYLPVVVEQFELEYQDQGRIKYFINLVPVVPPPAAPAPTADAAIQADMTTASGLVSSVGNSGLSGAFAAVQSAINSVSSFANAATSTINSVLQPIAAMQSQINTLISSAEKTVGNIASLGGLIPNNPVAQAVNRLNNSINGVTQSGTLYQLQAVMGRVSTNVALASSAGTSIPTIGGNLMQMASNLFGNVAHWSTIAQANKITDPQLTGAQNITIPATLPANPTGVANS